MMSDADARLGWWTISGEAIMSMLQRVHDGEEPFVVYAEEYANADHSDCTHDGDDDA
jgi:hypothetical protein